MRQDDINKALNRYIESNEFPDYPSHPFNTCHPLTGSWTERLLTTEEYQSVYQKAGFTLNLKNGHYDIHKKPFYRSVLNQVLNACIPLGGKSLAPYLILVGNSTVINEI